MKLNQKTVKKIIKYFSKKPEVAAVYLYGSYARGEATKDSDIGLGVVLKGKRFYQFNETNKLNLSTKLSPLLKQKVKTQNLAACPVDFAYKVICKRKLIYSADEKARIAFEEKLFRNYFDLKPALDEYYKYNPRKS